MIRRGQPPSLGMWALPGGLLDLGEPVRDGVVREVREETGAEIEVVELLDLFEPIHRDAEGAVRYHYVVIDFWAHLPRGGGCTGGRRRRGGLGLFGMGWDELPMEDATRRVVRKAHARWKNGRAVK